MSNKFIIFLIFISLSLIGCNAFKFHSTNKDYEVVTENLDPDTVNQKPRISCLITNVNTKDKRSVNTISEKDTFFAINPKEDDSLYFDCSNTEDEDHVSKLRFFIDDDYQEENQQFIELDGTKYDFAYKIAGTYKVAIKSIDTNNQENIKYFDIIVTCKEEIYPNITNLQEGIKVSPDVNLNKLNYFTYEVNPSYLKNETNPTDDSEPISTEPNIEELNKTYFSWDFNGDGIFDATLEGKLWDNKARLDGIYNTFEEIYTTNIKKIIKVKIRNHCNYESTFEISPLLKIRRNDESGVGSTAYQNMAAKKESYYYLQTDISDNITTISSDPETSRLKNDARLNGNFIATWYPDDKRKRVLCDYKKTKIDENAQFTIHALNKYGNTNARESKKHGFYFKVKDIEDIPLTIANANEDITSPQVQTFEYNGNIYDDNNDALRINTFSYYTDENDDIEKAYEFSPRDYEKCSIKMTIKRSRGVVPCDDENNNQTGYFADPEQVAIIILGEFNCPELIEKSNSNLEIKADYGKFYCEVQTLNQCVGGGGGGGGGITIIPQ